MKKLFIFFIAFAFPFFFFTSVFAVSESECLNKSVSELKQGEMDECINVILPKIAAAYAPAQEKNKAQLASLKKQVDDLNKRIISLSSQLKSLENQINQREEDLAFAKEIFEEKAENHYKFLRLYDPIMPFLSSNDASEAFREINFRQKAADEDRKTMEQYADELAKLKNDKESLEKNKVGLASLQKKVSEDAKFLEGEVGKVESFLSVLSAKQQEILAAKAGSFITSVGDVELADDYNASIRGFREAAPSGSFAVFSFGGYTHRKGMSQYGARGRAQNGQPYRQILNAYYGKEPVTKDTGGTIGVSGYGNLDFETAYLYGIAEMPSTWHVEALKAQAVAARTYAYRYKVQGNSICTSQSCQVFSKSKSDNPPQAWKDAVDSTRGQVLEDVITYYASTSGGYLATMGWDTTDGSGGNNFIDRAWEGKGGSPWLYKSWYRQGYTASGATCGKNNPWLSNTEFADIINAALVLRNRSDERITPVLCGGTNPYSHDELRNAASPYGGISSVSDVFVLQGNGNTNEVVINGSIRLSWSEFKQAYNLRAPGYLRIPQGLRFGSSTDFAFFNIEKK